MCTGILKERLTVEFVDFISCHFSNQVPNLRTTELCVEKFKPFRELLCFFQLYNWGSDQIEGIGRVPKLIIWRKLTSELFGLLQRSFCEFLL